MAVKVARRAIQGVERAHRKSWRGETLWHPTTEMLDDASDGDCICQWCLTECGWYIVAETIDAAYAHATAAFNVASVTYDDLIEEDS